ncbi:uncharacterized protein [Chelonus insularis]|uniref:uncharacterized protein n=1 Tax=Chelonus insularis TaxID=460826 RepID=UPI00158ACB12|nr:uncharacterized protein LOC118074877 [Chelonus insularis]
MNKLNTCLLLLSIIGACVCGVRTSKCSDKYRMSLLTNVHDDTACSMLSNKGVMMAEAAEFFIEAHNKKSDRKINLSVLDTCGTITGATKAMMKALESDDFSCIDPPFFLGLIGPESTENIDAVHKITSVLNIPHIVRSHAVGSPYLHYLHEESDLYLVEGILEIIEALRWKSFTLATRKHDDNEDDVQLIAKKVTMGAITRGLCVMIHEQDDDVFTSHVVYIGRPPKDTFKNVNATIIIVSEGNLKNYVDKMKTNNPVILLQDARSDIIGLEAQVKNSKWSNRAGSSFNPEHMRDLRWLESAMEIYAKTLDIFCKKTQCTSEINHAEWNTMVGNVISTRNAQLEILTRTLDIYIKTNTRNFEKLGEIKVKKNDARIYWDDEEEEEDEGLHGDNLIPEIFRTLLLDTQEKTTGCATSVKFQDNDDDDDVSKVAFDIDDHEFWTVVGVVGGIGVTMFTVGTLAVYIVYTNIRGPRSPKHKGGRRLERDGSLRRAGSDRELQVVTGSPRRPPRPTPRRDSSRSIGSIISDKSV